MKSDFESLAAQYMSGSSDAKMKQTIGQIAGKLKDSESQQLAQGLSRQYGDSVKQAAEAARRGDMESAKRMLGQIMSTPEGSAMASKILSMLGK